MEKQRAGPCRLAFSRVLSVMLWITLTIVYVICSMRRLAIPTWSDELVKDFEADAALLGTLSGAYFYAYAIVQLPSGILLDGFSR